MLLPWQSVAFAYNQLKWENTLDTTIISYDYTNTCTGENRPYSRIHQREIDLNAFPSSSSL